jgi:hypothetical protein
VFPPAVVIQCEQQNADREQRKPVHSHEQPLVGGVVDSFGHQSGRERKHGDREQDNHVQPQQASVSLREAISDRVVAEPGRSDREETYEVGQVERPTLNNPVEGTPGLTDRQIEHEQGDRDRKDAITERFQPRRADISTTTRLWHVAWH